MKEEYKTLKFQPFAYLTIDSAAQKGKGTHQKKDVGVTKIYPETVRLSTVDKSTMILTFIHNTL